MVSKKDLDIMLEETIVEQNDKLATMQPGTKEYDSTVDAVTKLTNLKNEIDKTKVNNWSQVWKIAVDVGLGVANLVVLIWATKASFKFEETGTITTSVGRKIQDKLFGIFKR